MVSKWGKTIMKRHIIFTFLLVLTGLQTACTMNSSFDCPNQAGVNCRSLDQVNSMVDSGQIRGRTQLAGESAKVAKIANHPEFEPYAITNGFIPGAPLRYGETVQRIWIAPYEDTEGNYHQDSFMYSIMQEGKWIGRPVKALTAS